MISFSKPVTEIIKERFSCRSYVAKPIEAAERERLGELLAQSVTGPLGTSVRFRLVAATEKDWTSLKGLGTYGFVRGASAYIVGAVERPARYGMEDFGFVLERAVLAATDMGLGTCWLGGTFSRSSFARTISPSYEETIPAVVALGYKADKRRWFDSLVRRRAGSDHRLPWQDLFFDGAFDRPMLQKQAGPYAPCLEMVRLGPSASNNQPWRIARDGDRWHLFLKRTPGYAKRNQSLLGLADLQRVDMGIAMCHFGLTADEAGLTGEWISSEPAGQTLDAATEYSITWLKRT